MENYRTQMDNGYKSSYWVNVFRLSLETCKQSWRGETYKVQMTLKEENRSGQEIWDFKR